MNIVDTLKQYRSVAGFLSDDANAAVIDNLTACMEGKHYYLPFIGQFSAGKSKLINRLVGKDVLPTKSIETTAFLTYISYAETESATLEYVDGTVENVEVEQIKKLDHQATCDGKAIAALHYYAPVELLKSGLTIVDTPGVNTLISEHVKMTEELLQNSQFIVYVTASSLSDSDSRMIKNIDSLGIEMIFVRTHIDEIHSSEENASETVKKEFDAIKALMGHEVFYRALCNEPSCPDFERWTSQYEAFTKYISLAIASDIEKIYTLSTINRLSVLKEKFSKALNAKLELLKKNAEKSDAEIAETEAELLKQRMVINNNLAAQADKISTSAGFAKSSIQSEIQTLKKQNVSDFKDCVQDAASSDDCLATAKRLFADSLASSVQALNATASDSVSKWRNDAVAEAQRELKEVEVSLGSLDVDFDAEFDDQTINAYAQKLADNQNDVAEKYKQLVDLNKVDDSELNQYGIERQNLNDMIAQYEELIKQGGERVKEAIDNYVPQYVKEGGKLGPILKKVGMVADIGMIFIPAAGWAKAATWLGKGATWLSKGGMLAKSGAKIVGDVAKVACTMSKADKAIDAVKLISTIKQGKAPLQASLPAEAKKDTNIFDYLSLSYWFEKVGNMIDPVTYTEDQKYKAEYNKVVKQMKDEVQMKVRQKVALAKKVRNIQDAEELKKIELEEKTKELERMKEEEEKERKLMEERSRKAIITKIIEDAIRQFDDKLSDYAKTLASRVNEEIAAAAASLSDAMKSFVNSQLDEVVAQLNDVKEKRANSAFDLNKEVDEINGQLAKLTLPNE